MFTGLSAFPVTPFDDGAPNIDLLSSLVGGLAAAGVDSIGALGSTGGYAYLSRQERRQVARAAVQAAGKVPVLIGVGAVSTREVLAHVGDAQEAGAAGVLLAPVSYQPLTDDEVFGLFEMVAAEAEVPVVVYDNPATTGFTFTEELHVRIAQIPGIASIKLPGVAEDLDDARDGMTRLQSRVPEGVTLGVSGDAAGARGLIAGCDVWYSVLAGVFPRVCLEIVRAAQSGDSQSALRLSDRLQPVWELFSRFGSYRTISAIATETGLVTSEPLHHPVRPLTGEKRAAVVEALEAVGDLS